MAIFHFSVQVISRAAGRSAVSAAAYRAGERLHDERLDRDHDFRARSGVEHSEILLPEGAPEQWRDRERLWNDVEAFEKRKDAQLAREVEFAIPREMTKAQGIELARDFVSAEFVDRGMIADLNVHWDIGADGQPKPHAHVMLTMREVVQREDGTAGFGAKVREWNDHENVERWRERWETHVNTRLAEHDIDARIDHRSLADQGIDLEPQSKIGGPAHRMDARGLEADRAEMHREIARENGDRIIAGPGIPANTTTDALCYLYDVLPTLGALTQVPGPKTNEGIDLSTSLRDPRTPARASLTFAYQKVQRALRDERFKLIRYPQIDRTQLFDLTRDPDEIHDLATLPEHAARVAAMTQALAAELKQLDDPAPFTVATPRSGAWTAPGR